MMQYTEYNAVLVFDPVLLQVNKKWFHLLLEY